jgi:hypothetical protein
MTDEEQIRVVVQIYFECMYESDVDKARAAFHPEAKITGYNIQGNLVTREVETFAAFVASQLPSAQEKGKPAVLEIVSVECAGNTAVAIVRDEYLGQVYLDILSLLKVEESWRIYNKLFHIEGPAENR